MRYIEFFRKLLEFFLLPDARGEEIDEAVEEKQPGKKVEVRKEPTVRDLEIARLLREEEERGAEAEVDDEPVWSLKRAQIEKPSRQCPYLDTIDRFFLHCL